MISAQTAAVGAAILIAGVAVYQLALALGLPLGEATLGGRAPTTNGVLSGAFRMVAGFSTLILVVVAWLVLSRAGVVGTGPFSDTFVRGAVWVILGFLGLNTIANFAAPHPVERWVIGTTTLVIVGLVAVVVART